MKRCTNCWTDNPDDAERCKKCGRPLDESWSHNKNYRLYWRAIVGGLLTAGVLAVVGYFLFGASSTFAFGLSSIPFIGGCVTAVLAYREEDDSTNSLVNALAAGLIMGVVTVVGTYIDCALGGVTLTAFFLIYIPSLAIWALFGGMLGGVINAAIENGRKSTLIISVILISIVAIIGYGIYEFKLYASYDNGAYGSAYDLDFVDIIQPEADAYLNAPYNTSEERLSNLNNAKVKYERMVNITVAAQPQVDEMIGNSSSSIKKEYALALNQYLHLKHDYCLEMYTGIQLEIKGNTEEAEKHYENAEDLIPKIQSQNKQIEAIINKDPSFKNYITEKRDKVNYDVNFHKAENMTFYLG